MRSIVVGLALIAVACGPASETPTTTAAPSTTALPTTTTTVAPPSTTTIPPSSTTTTTSSTVPPLTAPPPPPTRPSGDVASAIVRTYERGPLSFEARTGLRIQFPSVSYAFVGTYDHAQEFVTFEVALEGDVADQQLADLANRYRFFPHLTEFGVSDHGVLTRQSGSAWAKPDQRAIRDLSRFLGSGIPAHPTIPGVGHVLEAIVTDPEVLSPVRESSRDGIVFWSGDLDARVAFKALLATAYHSEIDRSLAGAPPIRVHFTVVDEFVTSVLIEGDDYIETLRAVVVATDGDASWIPEGLRGYDVFAALGSAESADSSAPEFVDIERAPSLDPFAQPGVCYGRTLSVELGVPGGSCDLLHRFEVFGTYEIPYGGEYPGEEAMFRSAEVFCSARSDAYSTRTDVSIVLFHPTMETWDAGDRLVVCGYESEDARTESLRNLPASAVSSLALVPGLCFSESDEFDSPGPAHESVACHDPHYIEVFSQLILGDYWTAFPGEEELHAQTLSFCVRRGAELDIPLTERIFTLAPTEPAYEVGDRSGLCVVEWSEPVTFSVLRR